MANSDTNLRHVHRQRGAILVTSMLLLLVLTVLGIAMIKMTNMQERMSGNTRDLNVALQAAEAALRDGERILDPFINANIPPLTSGGGCLICEPGALPIAIDVPGEYDWAADANEYGVDGTQEFEDLAEDPYFTIEETAFVADDLGRGINYGMDGRFFYQVSARSTGISGLTNVVLQTTYARPR
jgi:type IV pilus assembly protein PilX